MKKILAAVLIVATLLTGPAGCGSQAPLGVRLQRTAGDGYEVIYNPSNGIYTVEPK